MIERFLTEYLNQDQNNKCIDIPERKQTIHLNNPNKLEQIHVADANRGKTCAASFFFFGSVA